MKYLIDKVNQEEAKCIKEIINFFENNPTITQENVDASHKMLIEFNDLQKKYISSNYLESSRMLFIHQMKWDSDLFCSHPAERNTNSFIYIKHVAFGERHEDIIQLERTRKQVEQIYLNSHPFLFRILSKIKSLFKK